MNKIHQFLTMPINLLLKLVFKDYELRIARRYLFSFRREFDFISIITFISFLGITTGIAALIITLSIFNGFRDFAEEQMLSFDPHIKIETQDTSYIKQIEQYLENKGDKLVYSKAVEGKILIKHRGAIQAAYLCGLEEDKIDKVSGLKQKCVAGKYQVGEVNTLENIVLGAGFADKMGISPFDTISVVSPDMIEYGVKQIDPNVYESAVVSALFQSYSKETDDTYIFSSLDFANELFFKNNENKISYNIRLNDISQLVDIKEDISRYLTKAKVETWYDLHSDIFNIMRLERLMVFIVMSLIISIAAFNLLSSLTMTVIEKQRDIAVLKAMGMNDTSIKRIFIAEGLFIGLLSMYWGTLIALIFCYLQVELNIFKLDTTKYLIPGIPISIEWWNILIINVFALVLSSVSTLLPAKYAFKQKIAEHIKNN